ncbi:DNA polymerase [Pectobacterium phage Jarilo]|uniref:DNA polymerase n=1 Tax=Pectobacterium phage Jarilo TaxID=2163634 RepID=A0A2S1GSZ2_9CAUD|nr:DNA polymerase I [Pectobacterium phage Jarilo]AWD92503.1 DNA polymerase [Pectobacterium phage Jarilo]
MLVTDIEANGLLEKVTQFHCGVIYDYRTDTYTNYRPWDFKAYLEALNAEVARGGLIVFHNGHNYDSPALTKLAKLQLDVDFQLPKENVLDTLVLSRLLHANLKDTDMGLLRSGKLPGRRFGSHALEAWGYRLGEMKGEYKDDFKALLIEQGEEYTDGLEWVAFNEPMMDYNVQDVVVTRKFLEMLLTNRDYFPNDDACVMTYEGYTQIFASRFWECCGESVKIEHDAAWLLSKMERNGFPFDEKSIANAYIEWAAVRSQLTQKLIETFGDWYQHKGGKAVFIAPKSGRPLPHYPRVIYPKQGGIYLKPKNKAQREDITLCDLDKREYCEGAPYTPVTHIVFNPGSRDHILRKLLEAGWEPTEKTDSGGWKVDEEVLKDVKVDDPVKQASIKLILDYLTIQKRIGQAVEGDKAWMRYVRADGKVHGSVNPNGAVTGRATHSHPNMGQVPSGHAPYGDVCRAAFGAEHHLDGLTGKPWIQAGIDASGLELRCLAHFMSRFDDGKYADVILNGDIHWTNAIAADLAEDVPRDKSSAIHDGWRDNAKTFNTMGVYKPI